MLYLKQLSGSEADTLWKLLDDTESPGKKVRWFWKPEFRSIYRIQQASRFWKTHRSLENLNFILESLLPLGSVCQHILLILPPWPHECFHENFCSGLVSCLFLLYHLPSCIVYSICNILYMCIYRVYIVYSIWVYTSYIHFWKHRSKHPNFLSPKFSAGFKNGLEDFQWSDPHFYFYFSPYSHCVSFHVAVPACLLLPEIDTDLCSLVSFPYALPSIWELPPFSSSQMMTILRISSVLMVVIHHFFIPTAFCSYFHCGISFHWRTLLLCLLRGLNVFEWIIWNRTLI